MPLPAKADESQIPFGKGGVAPGEQKATARKRTFAERSAAKQSYIFFLAIKDRSVALSCLKRI